MPIRHAVAVAAPLLAALVPLAGAAPAGATTYPILTTADDTVINGNCTLREAIRAATQNLAWDACPPGGTDDRIELAAGTYDFTAGAENLSAGHALEIRSVALDPFQVTIDMHGVNAFLVASSGGPYTLRGLTITRSGGSALSMSDVDLTLRDLRLISNFSPTSGGALYYGGLVWTHTLTISGCNFSGNAADAGSGGGATVALAQSSHAELRDVLFFDNSASAAFSPHVASGGGLELTATMTSSATLARVEFQSNDATAFSGAAVRGGGASLATGGGASIRAFDLSFTGNTATADSGAEQTAALEAFANQGTSLSIDRLFVDLSSVADVAVGRDVNLYSAGASTLTVSNAQITFGNGRGVVATGVTSGVVNLAQATIADYASGTGAELVTFSDGGVYLEDSIVALNSTDLATSGSGVVLTSSVIGGDPQFVNPGAGDYRIGAGSPARDTCGLGAVVSLADLDHRPRSVGPARDCGAYEYGSGIFADDFEVGDSGSWSATAP